MNRRELLGALAAAPLAAAPERPNIIYILADDLGWGVLCAAGRVLADPNSPA